MRRSMADEHPLERLLRDAKEKDDLKAAVLVAEQRKALDLQEKGKPSVSTAGATCSGRVCVRVTRALL